MNSHCPDSVPNEHGSVHLRSSPSGITLDWCRATASSAVRTCPLITKADNSSCPMMAPVADPNQRQKENKKNKSAAHHMDI